MFEPLDADRRGRRARLQHVRAGHLLGELRDPAVVQDVNEVGHEDAGVARLHAHGELVAKVAGRRLAHAGDPQVLAQQGRRLDVEVVERHDAIDLPRARDVADALQQVLAPDVARDVEELLDRLARPLRIAQLVGRQQQHAVPFPMALAQELVTLLEGRDAQQGQCRRLRHDRYLLGSAVKKTGYTEDWLEAGGWRLAAGGWRLAARRRRRRRAAVSRGRRMRAGARQAPASSRPARSPVLQLTALVRTS